MTGRIEVAIVAANEIYNTSLQILNHYQIDAEAVPIVVESAAHRLEAFALEGMARELVELRSKQSEEDEADGSASLEVEDGEHPAGD